MNQTSRAAAYALMNHRRFRGSNTTVDVDPEGVAHLLLFGNRIAKHTPDGRVFITDAGWCTRTTQARLSCIPGVEISRRGGWQLNGSAWSGEWTEVYNQPKEE
jgi:hypothetical protein